MTHCRVQSLEARRRGVGRWRHRYGKYVDSLSTRKQEGCIFQIFPPWDRFQKSAFSVAAFSGLVWMVGQNDAIHVHFRTKTQKSFFVWTASQTSSRRYLIYNCKDIQLTHRCHKTVLCLPCFQDEWIPSCLNSWEKGVHLFWGGKRTSSVTKWSSKSK